MPRRFIPKIGRHVTIRKSGGRVRSGTITAVTDDDTVNLRVGHSGEVYTGLNKGSEHAPGTVWYNTLNASGKGGSGVITAVYPDSTTFPASNLYPGS